jgi:CSLREA domain-containing protein
MRNRIMTLCAAAACLTPALAVSASILVNTTDDEFNADGDCSLREAVLSANSNTFFDNCNAGTTGEDSITLLVTGTIALDSEIEVSEGLRIVGPGRDVLTIEAGPASRHFLVNMGDDTQDFSISSLTLSGGRSAGNGGAILALQVGTLRLDNTRFVDNRADVIADLRGGALAFIPPEDNGSRLEIHDSILEDNVASEDGGAVHAGSYVSGVAEIDVQRSVFARNEAGDSGGAIQGAAVTFTISDSLFEENSTDLSVPQGNDFGGAVWWFNTEPNALLLIERSTFSANAAGAGGALFTRGTVTIIRNTTFSGNHSIDDPGEAIVFLGDNAIMLFSTLVNNGQGGEDDAAIWLRESGDLTLNHSIIWADWQPTADCVVNPGSELTSNGFNIDSSGTCTSAPTDRPSTDPQLEPLANNGDDITGVVLSTHLPRPGSPALDGGSNNCPGPLGGATAEDQRGRPRPVPSPGASTPFCDIGAVEFQPADDPVIFSDRFEGSP